MVTPSLSKARLATITRSALPFETAVTASGSCGALSNCGVIVMLGSTFFTSSTKCCTRAAPGVSSSSYVVRVRLTGFSASGSLAAAQPVSNAAAAATVTAVRVMPADMWVILVLLGSGWEWPARAVWPGPTPGRSGQVDVVGNVPGHAGGTGHGHLGVHAAAQDRTAG